MPPRLKTYKGGLGKKQDKKRKEKKAYQSSQGQGGTHKEDAF